MSDSVNTISELKQELETVNKAIEISEKYQAQTLLRVAANIRGRIEQLEFEADPWRKAKDIVNRWCGSPYSGSEVSLVANFVGYLEDTISDLKAENANLQSIIDEFGEYNE